MWRGRATLARAYWPSLVFTLVGWAGFGVACFDRRRRALHDIVAGTVVARDIEPTPPAAWRRDAAGGADR
jgi:uncharacterized RDD family membrane protein YckC